jgi:hypothetical protein
MGEVVQNNQLWHHAKFEHFWISGWEQIRITKFEQLEKKTAPNWARPSAIAPTGVGFRPRQSLPTARCSDSCRRGSPLHCRFLAAPGYRVTLHALYHPREMRYQPYPLAAWLHRSEGPLFFLFARLCSLHRVCSACHRALCYRRVRCCSSVLCDAAPQAGHRVARRPINRHHRPLLQPVTDDSPLPELSQAAPHAPLPPAFLQPSHHPREVPTDAPPLYGSSIAAIDL